MSPWYVVLTEPQQEILSVWRVHLLGLEMFTPMIRKRVKTGRVHNGKPITRLVARPMFPSYGFIRQASIRSLDEILAMTGIRDFLRNERHELVLLPHEAVIAIYAKQQEEYDLFRASQSRRFSHFKPGDRVKVDDGGIYSGMIGDVDRIDSKGRIQVLFGMIRHRLPEEMVVAA